MKDLGFKYRKVNHIAMSANSERSLVLRQQWAITLLKQKPENKILINLDEVSRYHFLMIFLYLQTWLGMSDWRRFKW